MKYNFDEIIDRSTNRSSKYDERIKKFGTADVIPLWVADMDFRSERGRKLFSPYSIFHKIMLNRASTPA